MINGSKSVFLYQAKFGQKHSVLFDCGIGLVVIKPRIEEK